MGTLLLDVRNHYETRIGCFQVVRLCCFNKQESPQILTKAESKNIGI